MASGGGVLTRGLRETWEDGQETIMAWEPDYYIITLETNRGRFPWRWEIRRRGKPMGVKLGAGGYQTQETAERAGQQLLSAFSWSATTKLTA
jgi:hypothetical protein